MNNISDDAEARLRRAASPLEAPQLDPALVTSAGSHRAPRLVRHGRATRAAAASMTALAAVAVGALVVTNPFAPQAPLFLAAGGGATEAGALAADSRMAMWVNYDYVAGSGLATDGGRGAVYELRRTGTPESVLRDAADALGLSGEVTTPSWSSSDYPTYIVGPEDGSAPTITLSWSGIGEWWYSDPGAYPEVVCTTVPLEGGAEGESYDECLTPEVSAADSLAPSTAEATRLAAELFGVPESAVAVTADSWQTTATVNLVVGGQTTALVESIAWSPLGKVAWASGNSFEVVERGSYDTVSPTSAVERLADGRWFGSAGPDFQGGMMFAADMMLRGGGDVSAGSVSTENPDPSASVEPVAPDAPIVDEPQVDPGLTEPEVSEPGVIEPGLLPEEMPEPETVTVTLEKSAETLLLVWDADGNAWLVPGYAFENPDGGYWHTVISVAEGVIALPEPMQIEPLPAIG